MVFGLALILLELAEGWQTSATRQLTQPQEIVLRQTLKLKEDIESLSFSPDGRLVAVALLGRENVVQLYDSETLQLKYSFKRAAGKVVFCSDSKLIAAPMGGGKIGIWEVDTGRLKTTLKDQPGSPSDLEFNSTCTRMVASGGGSSLIYDGKARLWSVESGDLIKTIEHKGFLFLGASVKTSFSPDGKTFMTSGDEDGTPKIWDSETGVLKATLEGHKANVYQHSFSPNGQIAATASFDATIKLWDAHSGSLKESLGSCYAYDFAFSPDGQSLATACSDGNARLWSVIDFKLINTLNSTLSSRAITADFSPNGQTLAVYHSDHKCELWDTATGRLIGVLPVNDGFKVTFSPNSSLIMGMSNKREIKVWRARSGDLIGTLRTAKWPAIWSRDGKTVMSKGPDDTVQVWDLSGS